MISQSTIQQVKQRADILDVLSDFVVLKRRGANYIGLCPFHNEKTPSFSVSQAKQIYKCFGCGCSGSVVTFLMEHEKHSYAESIEWLANRYGIEIEKIEKLETTEQNKKGKSVAIFNAFAKIFFQHQLLHTEEGTRIAYSYLEQRGFSRKTMDTYEIGYSPSLPQALYKEAVKQQFDKELMLLSGTIVKRNNAYIDNYKGRIVFPIRHPVQDKTLGFAARSLSSDPKQPKYINTQQNELYNKSYILYGLYQAKQEIIKRKFSILVEGYTDVLSLYQAGHQNVVAGGGTSLTKEQAYLLKKYTNTVLLLYDGDQAGTNAALRGINVLIEQGLDVEVLHVPHEMDPSDYIRENGKEAFNQLLKSSKKSFIDFMVDILIPQHSSISDKNTAINQIADTLSYFHQTENMIKRQEYIKYSAAKADVDVNSLNHLVNVHIRNRIKKLNSKIVNEQSLYLQAAEKRTSPLAAIQIAEKKRNSSLTNEKQLIAILLNYGAKKWQDDMSVAQYIINYIEEKQLEDEIKNEHIREMLTIYKEQLKKGNYIDGTYFMYNDQEEIRKLAVMINKILPTPNPRWREIITDYDVDSDSYYKKEISTTLCLLCIKMIRSLIHDNQNWENAKEPSHVITATHNMLKSWEMEVAKEIGIVILKS